MIRADVELITEDFEARRRITDLLDVQLKLIVEDDQKVVYISCRLSREKLSIMKPKRSFLP